MNITAMMILATIQIIVVKSENGKINQVKILANKFEVNGTIENDGNTTVSLENVCSKPTHPSTLLNLMVTSLSHHCLWNFLLSLLMLLLAINITIIFIHLSQCI